MTTLSASERGRVVETRVGKITTPGVLPSAWTPARFYDLTSGMSRPLVQDQQLGVGLNNARDMGVRRQGLPGGSLSRTVPLNLNEIGTWLAAGFHRSTSGSASNYVHTFSSGADPDTLLALVQKYADTSWTWDMDVALASMKIVAQKADTTARAQLTLIGLSDDEDDAAPAGTVASAYAADDFSDWRWQALWNDVAVGDVLNVDLTLDLGVERIQGLSGDEWPSRHHFGESGASGSFRMYGRAEAFRAIAADASTGKLTLKATHPSDTTHRYFKVDLAVTQFEKPQRTVQGPGQMSADLNFVSSQDGSNAAIVATLANAVASY